MKCLNRFLAVNKERRSQSDIPRPSNADGRTSVQILSFKSHLFTERFRAVFYRSLWVSHQGRILGSFAFLWGSPASEGWLDGFYTP